MSILLKGNYDVGGPNIPPENVSNVKFTDNKKGSVNINWKDPDDIVLEGVNISTWQKTVLVYKQNSEPISITDGTVIENYDRNKYMNTPLNINITPDVLYYFKFFTVNDKNKVNSSDKSYSFTSKGVSTILKDNDWSTIIDIANKGEAQNYWKIGDEIDITLKGTFNETITLQIYDFNHFDKSDNTGKANICFGMKNLMKDEQYIDLNPGYGGWNTCDVRKNIIPNILSSINLKIRNHIKEVNTYACGESSGIVIDSIGLLSKDKVFIPGANEIPVNYIQPQYRTEKGQKKFPIFTGDNVLIKKLNNGSGPANTWWTRSMYYNDDRYYYCTTANSDITTSRSNNLKGICFCFNI